MEDRNEIDAPLGHRLRALRTEQGWSLDELAQASGVSRATLSRLENAEVSATAAVLAKLCAVHGLSLSRLMHLVEERAELLVPRAAQPVWRDPETAFERRSVSPPAPTLAGEVLECTLGPGVHLAYDGPPRAGLEHHLLVLEGRLAVTIDARTHDLVAGDCLRYRLDGPSAFRTPAEAGARYLLFLV